MKRALSILLAVLMLAAVFAGCTGSEQGTTTTNTTGTTPTTTPASTPAKGIGTADNPVKVTILEKDVSMSEEDVVALAEAIEKGMAEQGNYVDIEWVEPPAGKYVEVVPLAVRTGQISADIIYFQNGVELSLANEGLLEDLTPYIENSTYIKEILEDHNKVRLQNYPYLLWMSPPMTYVGTMRSDWLDKLDIKDEFLANPTIDNYYALFKELKDKGICEYPLTTDNNKLRLDGVFNMAFGVTSTVMEENGKYIFYHVSQGEKAKLEFLAKLYAEGLFDSEFITNTWDVMEQKFYEGKSAVISARAGDVMQIHDNKMTQTHGESAALTILPPAKGVEWAYAAVDDTREPRGFAISADSKVKEAAFAVLDFICSPEGRTIDKLGIEGVHHKVENGKTVLTDKYPEWWSRFFETTNNLNPEPPLATSIYTPAAEKSLEMIKTYYKEDRNVLIPEDLAPQWDAMINLYNEYYSDIIRGVKPISAFDEFVQKWNEAGGTQFASYLSEQLG